jgi:hypothetical protein
MGILGKIFKKEPDPECDVCSNILEDFKDGYVLTTTQVTTSETYWEFAFTHQWSPADRLYPEGKGLLSLVMQQAGHETGWLVCEDCIQLFNVDRKVAKDYAKRAWRHRKDPNWPPGGGPADPVLVALAAAKA